MHEAPSIANSASPPTGDTSRVILHFDYDCFYCSVFEAYEPTLRTVPFAVQQIIVTCNYEARRRGLYKLQLVTDAKRACPDLVIRLGEDLDPFRAASKKCFQYLASNIWSGRAERLGFDEVWLDVGDMVDFNVPQINGRDSFFQLHPTNDTKGFIYDATTYAGYTYPENEIPQTLVQGDVDPLTESTREAEARLVLGSHLARYLRQQLEEQLHFTATVGISVNKVLSKLVGNCHKPNGQTTLAPPYFASSEAGSDHVQVFMDSHDIGKVPGIGFKSAQALRSALLGRAAEIHGGLVYGYTKEDIRVADVRTKLNADLIDKALSGPGATKEVGQRIWALIHGIEESAVAQASTIPTQISLEDSYLQLEGWTEIRTQLLQLTTRLMQRVQLELYDRDSGCWLAHAQTLRLTTRPRPPRGPDGIRMRSFKRISRSAPMPSFVFTTLIEKDEQETRRVSERLVAGYLTPMFRALHPRSAGLDLSLINVAATNVAAVAPQRKSGRDIGNMFRAASRTLDKGEGEEVEAEPKQTKASAVEDNTEKELRGSEDIFLDPRLSLSQKSENMDAEDNGWREDELLNDYEEMAHVCSVCGAYMPPFAWAAHARYHDEEI